MICGLGVQFAEHPVCERVNDRIVAVVDIGAGEHDVDNLAFLVAQQVQLEPHVPPHGALFLHSKALEHFHAVLPLVVYDREARAVDKADAHALPETGQAKEHGQRDEAARHHLEEAVVRETLREQVLPKTAHAGLVIVLEVAVGVEVEADEDCDDLGVRHLALATAFWGIRC